MAVLSHIKTEQLFQKYFRPSIFHSGSETFDGCFTYPQVIYKIQDYFHEFLGIELKIVLDVDGSCFKFDHTHIVSGWFEVDTDMSNFKQMRLSHHYELKGNGTLRENNFKINFEVKEDFINDSIC